MPVGNKTNLTETRLNTISFACLTGGFVILVFTFFYLLQFSSPNIVGTDGYFHIKYSYLMRKVGFIWDLPWLQFTVHKDYYRDHHFLQHILYIPFTFGDLLNGAKWTAVVFPTIAICCAYGLLTISLPATLKKGGWLNVWPFLWAALVLVSSHSFLYRMSMPRIQSISLACLLATMYFMLKRKYLLLAILSFFFVWLYDAFIFTFIIALCFFASRCIMKKEWDFRLLIYCIAGLAIGIVANPYFPHNISSYIFNLTRTTAPAGVMSVGSEWKPYSTWFFATDSGATFIVLFGAIIVSLIRGTRLKDDTLGLLFFSLLLLIMFLKSRRWVEYWPPFAVILAAFLMRDVFEHGILKSETHKAVSKWQRATSRTVRSTQSAAPIAQSATRNLRLTVVIVLVMLLAFFLPRNFINARKDIKDTKRSDFYKGAALWLKEHTEPKSVVFNTDWDDFPFLFFYNSENYYIVGLAPDYMYYFDPELYIKWKNITRGKIKNPSTPILETFGTRYVITDNGHKSFIKNAKKDKRFRKEYQDSFCTVFSINSP